MVKKNKLRYKNFNVCQLIDKGNMKLQYTDNYKEAKKIYRKMDKKKDKCSVLKKYNVKNINKKILTGIFVLTMMSTFSGCNESNDFNYSRQKFNGREIVEVSGTMSRSIAEDLKVIELKVYDESYLFLARRYDIGTKLNGKWAYTYEYWEVFDDYKIIELTDEVGINPEDIIFNVDDIDLVKEESFGNYLLSYGIKDSSYTPKRLNEIFNKIKDEYVFEEEKTLVKGK